MVGAPSNRRYQLQNVFEKVLQIVDFLKIKNDEIQNFENKCFWEIFFTANFLFCFATGIWTYCFSLKDISPIAFIFKKFKFYIFT